MIGEEEPTTNDRFIYEQIKQRYDSEHARARDLDTKAGQLVGWTGLIISIIFAGGGVLFTRIEGEVALSRDELTMLVSILSFLIVSLAVSLAAFRAWHYIVVPEAKRFLELYSIESHATTLRRFVGSMVQAIEDNQKRNNIKAQLVGVSWGLFLAGMGLTAIFIYIQAVKIAG